MKHISLISRSLVICFISIIFLLLNVKTTAQVKVGDNPNTIKNASLLELESTNKGLVMPRVSLSGAITSPAPLAADILPGTIVYNTNAAFVGGTGLQIWTGTTWMVITPSSLSSSDAWKLTGNSGTNPANNFIGTTDAQPLVFKVNNQKSGMLDFSNTAANTAYGYQSLNVNMGNNNTASGYMSLPVNTTGNYLTAIGAYALNKNTTASYNTAIGAQSLINNTTGENNISLGVTALLSNTTGNINAAFGNNALRLNTTGSNNTATGFASLYSNTTGNNNNGYGLRSLNFNTSGNLNVAYGDSTLFTNTTGNFNTAIGHYADVTNNNLTNATAIGYNAKVAVSNALVLGNTTDNVKIGIGTSSPAANLHVKGTVKFEDLINGILTSDAAGNLSTTTLSTINGSNWSLTGNSGTNPANNFIGTIDAQPLVFKVNGSRSGYIDQSKANASFGYLAFNSNTSGINNAAVGSSTLTNNTTGTNNSAIGYVSLEQNTTGSSNVSSGNGAMRFNTTGSFNTGYGSQALNSNTTGTYNTAIGAEADVASGNLTNATAIGYNAQVNISNALILGDSISNIKIGIGTGSPTANLHVKGNVRFAGLTNGVLTADASGNLSTTTLSAINGNSWNLTGNSGTNTANNFIGTTDAQPLVFKVNGQRGGFIGYSTSLTSTSLGYQSLNVNTANDNTAIGYFSMLSNTTGSGNTASGVSSFRTNTTGSSNTANGWNSLYGNTTGNNNTATGAFALNNNNIGTNNTGVGYQALGNNTSGNNNTAIGIGSLQSNTTGTNNIAIGNSADVGSNNLTNAIAIGYNAKADISNSIILGNTTDNVKVGIGTSSPGNPLTVKAFTDGSILGFYNNSGADKYNFSLTNGGLNLSESNVAAGRIFIKDGGNVGIRTITPTANLHVNGTVRFESLTNGVLTADASGNLSTTSLSSITGNSWSLTGNSGTSPANNFIGTTDAQPLIFKVNGQKAGLLDYDASHLNTSFGLNAFTSNTTGTFNTAMGSLSLTKNTSGGNNTASGAYSLNSNTTGGNNTASGANSLATNVSGSSNAAFGAFALGSNNANNNTALGSTTLVNNTTGASNTATGSSSLVNNTTGASNTAIGSSSLGLNTTGSNNTALGYGADVTSNNLTNATAIGYNARVNISNALVLGDSMHNVNIGIGTGTPTANLHVKGTVRFGGLTNGVLTADANGNLSTTNLSDNSWSLTGNSGTDPSNNFIGTIDAQPLLFKVNGQLAGRLDYLSTLANTSFGYQSLNAVTTGTFNVSNGFGALTGNTSGANNTAIGGLVLLLNTTGSNNTATGFQAIRNNTTGTNNVANGSNALASNTTGGNNTAAGYVALSNNTIGSNNVASGNGALAGNTSGSNNTGYGSQALTSNTTGSGNTAIGSGANVSSGNLTNATAIGANANVAISNAMVLGSGVNVGIGNSSPTANLHVKGTVRFENLTNGILTADANGNLSTTSLSANSWSLTGNSGTNPSNNFIGTSDAQPLVFKVGGEKAGRIDNFNSAFNTSLGFQSLNAVTSGTSGVGIGFQALYRNTTGESNTAIGYEALDNNTDGSYNSATGFRSLHLSKGDQNTATGSQSLFHNTTGASNTAFGYNSLFNNYTGTFNTAIGYAADVIGTNLTNATAIGANAKVNASNAIVLGDNAAIGIGTSSPGSNAKVEIVGGTNRFLNNYQYMVTTGTGYSAGGGNATYSLYTSNRIWCGEEIDVTSDMRTKTNIVTSGSSKNLSLINKLRVVNYNYKDKVAKGSANITGFLAQEVEQVMPDAVTKNTGVVPDIYQNATSVKYDEASKILTLTLKEIKDVKAGDTIKLISNAGEQLSKVSSVNGNTITVGNWTNNSKWVFVYGKQVNDLRNLDYNKIFSAGIGAIQELSEQNDELKKQNNDIQKQNTSMQQDIDTLKMQVKMLMDKMNATAKSN